MTIDGRAPRLANRVLGAQFQLDVTPRPSLIHPAVNVEPRGNWPLICAASPLATLLAGGIAATALHVRAAGSSHMQDSVSDWLRQPSRCSNCHLQSIGALAKCIVLSVTKSAPQKIGKRSINNADTVDYPSFWTAEDIFVWEASRPAPNDCHDEGRSERGPNLDFAAQRNHASGSTNAGYRRFVDRALVKIAGTLGDQTVDETSGRWCRTICSGIPLLLASIFGAHDTALAARCLRLAFRFLRWTGELALPLAQRIHRLALPNQSPKLDDLCFAHPKFLVVPLPPAMLLLDDAGRPHGTAGPFCRWSDGFALFAVHGFPVPERLFDDPPGITPAQIDDEANVEVRRVMLERYGAGRFICETGATSVDHDPRFGTLYRRELRGDEALTMVEVINATPEPDGTHRHYWLRVPPTARSAREGVAWTFGLEEHEYEPQIET